MIGDCGFITIRIAGWLSGPIRLSDGSVIAELLDMVGGYSDRGSEHVALVHIFACEHRIRETRGLEPRAPVGLHRFLAVRPARQGQGYGRWTLTGPR